MARTILELLTEDNFAQLQGLNVSGSVPLRQDAINEALVKLVEGWSEPRPDAAQKAEGTGASRFLTLVRKLAVRVEPGVVHVDFEMRR